MATTGIYENLPLKPLNKDGKENRISETQKTKSDANQKKRKSTSELQGINNVTKGHAKTSATTPLIANPEDSVVTSKREKSPVNSCSSDTIRATNDEEQRFFEFDDLEVAQAGAKDGEKPEGQKIETQHSTPTSGLDDGYGSCNSTPHGPGESIFCTFLWFSMFLLGLHVFILLFFVFL